MIGIDGVVGLPVLLSVEKMPGETFIPRLLLLRGNFGQESKPMPIIAKISQDTLAKMVGTTRPRIGFFMNRLRKLGFVEYGGGRVHIHSSLLSVVLHD